MGVKAPHFAEAVNRNTRYISTAPCDKLAVAVLSDYKRMHAAAVYAEMLTEEIFQAGCIKHCSRAEHSILRKAAELCRRKCEDINRISYNKNNTVPVIPYDLGYNRLEYANILFYKVKSCFPGLLTCTCGHYDYRGVRNITVVACINIHLLSKGKSVANIESFSLRFFLIIVDKHKLREQAALHKCKCRCRAYKPAAYYSRFSAVHLYHIRSFLSASVFGHNIPFNISILVHYIQ